MAVICGKIISVTDKEGRTAKITTRFAQMGEELTKLLSKNGYLCKDTDSNYVGTVTIYKPAMTRNENGQGKI